MFQTTNQNISNENELSNLFLYWSDFLFLQKPRYLIDYGIMVAPT